MKTNPKFIAIASPGDVGIEKTPVSANVKHNGLYL